MAKQYTGTETNANDNNIVENPVMASLGEAEEMAALKQFSWEMANTSKGTVYSGQILGVARFHTTQSLGRTAVIHETAYLNPIPVKGDIVDIVYDGQQAEVQPSIKCHDKSLAR